MQHDDFRASSRAGLQQRAAPADNRQQQQDNGTHEFQPPVQQGDGAMRESRPHSLEAYLQRSRQLGEMPRPRLVEQRPRPELRVAK